MKAGSLRPELLLASLLFAGLTQWQWATSHTYQHFILRWFGVAFVCFLVFVACHRLITGLLGENNARRFRNSALIFSVVPLVLFLHNAFAVAVFILLLISASLIVLFDLTGTKTKIAVSGIVFVSVLTWLISNAAVSFDGVTMVWSSPDHDLHIAMFGIGNSGIEWGQRSGDFEFAREGLIALKFNLRFLEKNTERLGVRFWSKIQKLDIGEISFDSTFLLWRFPLLTLRNHDLTDYLELSHSPVERKDSLVTVTPHHRVSRSWLYLSFDPPVRHQLYSMIDPRDITVLRVMWWLSGLFLYIVTLFLCRLRWDFSHIRRYWVDFFTHPAEFDQKTRYALLRQQKVWIVGGITLLIVLVFARSWEALTTDALFMEDAALHFNKYYGGEQPFTSIFDRPNRYIAFITNLQAWLYAKLDVTWQPDLYRYSSFILAVMAASCFSFSGLFRQPVMLLAVPSVLGLAGLNHIFFWNTITYQIFTAVVLVICLLFLPAPATKPRLILRLVLIAILIWSGPYSVMAVPVAFLLLLFRVHLKNKWVYVWTIVCGLLYFAMLEQSTIQRYALFNEPDRLHHFYSVLFEKILLLDMFGESTSSKVALPIVLVVFFMWFFRKDHRYVKVSLVIFSLILGSLLLYFLTVKYKRFEIQENHILLSYYFWLVFLLMCIDRFLEKLPKKKYIHIAVLIGLVLFVWRDNHLHTVKRYWSPMDEIPGFMTAVQYFESQKTTLAREGKYVIVSTEPRWPPLPGPTAIIGKRNGFVRIKRRDVEDAELARYIVP